MDKENKILIAVSKKLDKEKINTLQHKNIVYKNINTKLINKLINIKNKKEVHIYDVTKVQKIKNTQN